MASHNDSNDYKLYKNLWKYSDITPGEALQHLNMLITYREITSISSGFLEKAGLRLKDKYKWDNIVKLDDTCLMYERIYDGIKIFRKTPSISFYFPTKIRIQSAILLERIVEQINEAADYKHLTTRILKIRRDALHSSDESDEEDDEIIKPQEACKYHCWSGGSCDECELEMRNTPEVKIPGIGNVRGYPIVYKLRAECTKDIIDLMKRMMSYNGVRSNKDLGFYPIVADFGPLELTFWSRSSPGRVRHFIRQKEDSHVMVETVRPIDQYTGERTYDE